MAVRVVGSVTDANDKPLAYASILVKGTTRGTTTNTDGKFFLDLEPGDYTIVAQYVGYQRKEQVIHVGDEKVTVNFKLSIQQTVLKEVVVKQGAEDPAYEIIRNAIRKRKEYMDPLDSFVCEVYIKTLVKTRKLPDRILGQKLDQSNRKEMGVDSAGKGILFLSESLTKVAYKKPDKVKLEVLSGRESGSNGFGFNFPTFINFYNNNVSVFSSQLNPRGFVSPIAEGALNYYRYKYLGSFYEDGKEVNEIQVIPKRKFEPLFSGTINITEGDWRIHSLDLVLTKESQLELIDSLTIRQIQVPVSDTVWRTKDQVVTFTFKRFGIEAVGNFLNVYNGYELDPQFRKKYFNKVVVKYDTTANKKSKAYWDSIRPIPLEPEEVKDYRIKDSAFQAQRDSAWSQHTIDSLRKKQGNIKIGQVLWTGVRRSNFDPKHLLDFRFKGLFKSVQYNTVEGVNMDLTGSVTRSYRPSRSQLIFTPHVRYGFNNGHLNPWASLQYNKRSFSWSEDGGSYNRSTWLFSGGKRVSQFNKDNPIRPLFNSIWTLLFKENYMKIYENYFGELRYSSRWDNGLDISGQILYEDRIPIDNTTDFSLKKNTEKIFTPNYPYEIINSQFARHQAFIAAVKVQFKPGQKYIEYPRGKVAVGSKYPTLSLEYQQGFNKIFGSDVDFGKWKFSAWDDINLKLLGDLKYRFSLGGFVNTANVPVQDYQHFNGNQIELASEYLNSFQIAPYYANSTIASFYAVAHVEHHFNGLLTNKIPLFRRLNWHLVAGTNTFYVNNDNNYVEVFGGIENIFKMLRVDVVASYLNGTTGQVGVRFGFGGLLGGIVSVQ